MPESIEAELNLTRETLKTINRYHFPVHIITKGKLVTRDMDILKEIMRTYAAVSITITCMDNHLAKIIEPGAPSTSERFNAIKTLSDHGIYCGVLLTPVLPFITDQKENIKSIIRKSAECGAHYLIGCMGMTQRPGQREYYYQRLNHSFPGLIKQYIFQYKNNYNCPTPNANQLYELFYSETVKQNIPTKMEHYKQNLGTQQSLF